MISQALYHCACDTSAATNNSTHENRGEDGFSQAPLTTEEYHPLASLYFCEECDAIRCPRCVTSEVNIYFCPLCQFEVPSASVRAEQHTCARNCFLCPVCSHTCSVTGTEPPLGSTSAADPPYWLWCQACKWDSKQVGITFERPTGLARACWLFTPWRPKSRADLSICQSRLVQLQKMTPADPATTEFDRLRDHLEPFLKAGLAVQAGTAATASTPAPKGLSSLPSRYGSLMNLASYSRSRSHSHLSAAAAASATNDDPDPYKPEASSRTRSEQEASNLGFMAELDSTDQVAPLGKRAHRAWAQQLQLSSLKPSRVPLQARRTKRCPTCKHILVKPESKSNSTKFRIKLVATNYLPSIQVFRRPPTTATGSRLSAAGAASSSRRAAGRAPLQIQPPSSTILMPPELDEPMRSGRSYSFELAFVNPLYEPITVEAIALKADQLLESIGTSGGVGGGAGDVASATDFSVNLPSGRFPIAAFAEQWEYEDAEPEDLDILGDATSASRRTSSSAFSRRRQTAGILEKKANRTTVLLDLSLGKAFVGPVMVSPKSVQGS